MRDSTYSAWVTLGALGALLGSGLTLSWNRLEGGPATARAPEKLVEGIAGLAEGKGNPPHPVSAGPSGLAPSAPDRVSRAELVSRARDRLGELDRCSREGDCGMAETDPKSQYFAVAQEMGDLLDGLRGQLTGNPQDDQVIAEIARRYLGFAEDGVREKALAIFSAIPPDERNADAILAQLEDCADPDLFKEAVTELARYQGAAGTLDDRIAATVESQILHGSPFMSQAAIEALPAILSAKNIVRFEQALQRLPADSARGTSLKQTIERYRSQV